MSRKIVQSIIIVLSFGLFTSFLNAEPEEINQIPKFLHPPEIDGVLDDPLWQEEALKIEGFLQFSPVENGAPSEKTEAYIGYDQKNLYFAFKCYDAAPSKLRASITNRDNILEDDWVVLFLDTFNEKRRAYAFFLNPRGIQMDMIRTEEGGNDRMDSSWDTVFQSDGRIDESGYLVEMAIPFKSIRFPDKEQKVWGITLGRTVARTGEIIIWPPASKSIPGLLCQSGEIMIPGKVEKGKNFELMPVFTSLKTKEEKIDPQPGLNFKWGISSDLTLDMTINPDFSQIEADAPQIDVNQRFALYYPEKRPFFLEGMEIFQFPEIQMVYTRRIIDPIAGAKLTGKVGRFTYGLLSVLDTSPTESLWDVQSEDRTKDQNALFNIFRVKTDVFKESYVGFSLTDKEINGSFNRVAGVDGQFKFKEHLFVSFQAMASKTRFEEDESEIAPALYGNVGYYTKHWGGGVYWLSIHPDFEAASGFVNRTDYRSMGGYSFVTLYPEKKYLNQVRFSLRAGRRLQYHESILDDQWVNASLNLRLTEFSQLYLSYQRDLERYEGIEFHQGSFSLNGDLLFISWLPLGFYFETGNSIYYDPDDPFLGYSNTYAVYFTVKPDKRIRLSMSFSKQIFWEGWGGEQIYDFNVLRTRTTYQLSKALSLRAIIDYNHYSERLYGSFLVSYILNPGTVFFFGVDNNLLKNDFGRYAQTDYSVYIKLSYWHRL